MLTVTAARCTFTYRAVQLHGLLLTLRNAPYNAVKPESDSDQVQLERETRA